MRILEGIGETRKAELLKQMRAAWTHDSTAIEGGTLTVGGAIALVAEARAAK